MVMMKGGGKGEVVVLSIALIVVALCCTTSTNAQSLTGNWTGFVNGTTAPLFDWYQITYNVRKYLFLLKIIEKCNFLCRISLDLLLLNVWIAVHGLTLLEW